MEYLFLAWSAAVSLLLNLVAPARQRGDDSVVVFKLDHIGDLATAAPALRALRARRPESDITLVVGSWCEELARTALDVDCVAVYDSPSFDRSGAARPPGAFASLTTALGGRRFGTAYGLRDDAACVRYCLGGGAVRRRDRGSVRLADRVSRFFRGSGRSRPLHEIETNLRIVGASDEARAGGVPFLSVSPGAEARIGSEILGGFVGGRRVVVVHPGAWDPRRRWPVERYRELVARLIADTGSVVIVTGTAAERELAEEAADGAPSVRVLAGELSVAEMVALLAAADVYVGVDTGMMHVSVGVGTPVVALFGPADPLRFGPTGPDDVAVSAGLDCAPCDFARCPRDAACMREIEVDDVMSAVERVLARGGASAPGASRGEAV